MLSIKTVMVKTGWKTSACFLAGYVLAQILHERGLVENALIGYHYAGPIRDVITLLPDEWEEKMEMVANRAMGWVISNCSRWTERNYTIPR